MLHIVMSEVETHVQCTLKKGGAATSALAEQEYGKVCIVINCNKKNRSTSSACKVAFGAVHGVVRSVGSL